MRYRTAAILSVVVIVTMFTFPRAVEHLLLTSLPNPVPGYDQVLLIIAEFCVRWSWVSAPVIPILLFTVASLTAPPIPRRNVALKSAKRPVGILVLAIVNFVAGLAGLILLGTRFLPPGDLSMVVVLILLMLLFNIVCTVGLMMLKNWARIVFIAVFSLALIRTLGGIYSEIVSLSNQWIWTDLVADICYFCLLLWIVWYLFRPHVRAAFGSA